MWPPLKYLVCLYKGNQQISMNCYVMDNNRSTVTDNLWIP